MKDIFILEGARTAWAEYAGTPGFGAFKDIPVTELGATAARGALQKAGIAPSEVHHVIFGNAMQTSEGAIYGARHVALKSGIPVEVPALTINRLCGSGIEAVALAARFLKLGEGDVALAGGMESMSQAPYVVRGLRGEMRLRFGQEIKLEDSLFTGLKDTFCDLYMAQTSDNCARKYGISREAQDEYALRSHREGTRAVQSGLFKQEIVPVPVRKGKEVVLFETDDHIKPDTTLEKLAKLPPAFGKDGTVTAGNASGIVDGAAAVVVSTHRTPAAIGRIIDYAAVGVEPAYMGLGPAPAIRTVLRRAGLTLDQIDLFEINEAFAGQYLAVEKELGLNRSRVNVNGGSIALGHPLGATGTRLILTLLYELRRRRQRLGIASACIGGGQGIAMIVEAL